MDETFRPDENHKTLLYWLVRAADALGRAGYEGRESSEALCEELRGVIHNFGYTAYTHPPEAEGPDGATAELLARGPVYGPRQFPIPEGFSLAEAVKAFEGEYVAAALLEAGGVPYAAAELLGMRRQTLDAMLRARHRSLSGLRTPMKPRPGARGGKRRRRERGKRP